MRICWILPEAQMTGGTKLIATYARKLRERGHEVVAISTPPAPISLRLRARYLIRERRWHSLRPGRSPLDDAGIEHRILDRARPVTDADVPDGDVVVATWWETAEPVAALSPRKGAKAYLMMDYGAPGMEIERIAPTWKLPLHIVTIAAWLVELIHEHAPEARVDLVPCSVDPEEFHAPPRGRQAVPAVGFNYRDAWSKGPDIVLEAFKLARERIPHLQLKTYGPVPVSRRRALPEGMSFRYLPKTEELKDIYAACDAWLFASRREGFGLQIVEAMACRTPVIATPAGAAPELIAARGGGVLVGQEDPEDMARAIERFCTMDEAEWRRFSNAALATVAAYTWDDATDRLEKALAAAIERTA